MKLILIGPQPQPITGLSLANQTVLNYLPEYANINVDCINTNYTEIKEDIGKFSLKKVFYYIKKYKELYKIKESDKVYITIGQTFFGVLKYLPYFLFSKILKKEVIIHIHGNHLWKEYESLKGIKKKIFHKIISMADKGIVLSGSLRKNLTPFLHSNKIYILENFVEDFIIEHPKKKQFDKLKIVYLSNLMKEKGILDLLQALRLLQEEKIEFKAHIAGGIDNSLKTELEKELNELSNVTYLGLVYGKEKKELLEWGNVFIFPTYYSMEGQPISIFEAMATGNVILTTAHAGIPDVFNENINGYYIKKKSPSSIVSKLVKMNKDLEKYRTMSDNNRKEAKEKYRVENFIKKLTRILED